MADTPRGPTRYRVNIDRAAAVRQFSQPDGAKGFTGAFGRIDGGERVVAAELTMAQARRMNRLGLLTSSDPLGGPFHNAQAAGLHPRQGRYSFAAPHIVVDLRDMDRLAQGYHGIATRIKKGATVISQAINHGLRKLRTEVTNDVVKWVGSGNRGIIYKSVKPVWSTPATLTGLLNVKSGHLVVTKAYFGASWNRRNPGATHKAWNRGQLAKGTFMIPGKKPVFRRLSSQRKPLAPIWGPNPAREVERHQPEVQAKVTAIGVVVSREAARLMSVAISQAR